MATGRWWRWARLWHWGTVLVAVATLVTQTVHTVVRPDSVQPDIGLRLFDLASLFTIQSNLAVLVGVLPLALQPGRDGVLWRGVRATSIVGITVTGVVHWFLLRPLSNPTGLDQVTDTFLHVVIPLLAVSGWVCLGPRPRMDLRTCGLALVWPICWLAVTLVRGAIIDWYPYPFLDVTVLGGGPVTLMCLLLTAGVVLLLGLMTVADRLLPAGPRQPQSSARIEVAS